MKELEPIIRYRMDATESKAYKIALMWEDECRREIPGEQYARIKSGSDPRKSLLFKYCFKLARETKGIVSDPDLQLYIRSQIQILKSINDGTVHALIEPHCLVGDKAWKRWKLWKYRYDKTLRRPPGSDQMSIRATEGKIKADLASTLEFLRGKGISTFSEMEARRDDLRRWCNMGEVSCFYLVMSPWARRLFGDLSALEFDHVYHRASVTPAVEQHFRETFAHEFEGEPQSV